MTNEKKAGRYARIYAQAETLIKATTHPVSRMATLAALLHHKQSGFFWTGFYLCVPCMVNNLVVQVHYGGS